MELRINKYDIAQEELLKNIDHYFDKAILSATTSVLDETLERDYFFRGENIPIFRKKYECEVVKSEGLEDVYKRTCKLYAYYTDGTLRSEPISERPEFYLAKNVLDYKISLFKSSLSKITKKATEEGVIEYLNDILDESAVASAINKVMITANTEPLITALENSTYPLLAAPVPNWTLEDCAKFGKESDYYPNILEWLKLHFKAENFDNIYPQKIEIIIE